MLKSFRKDQSRHDTSSGESGFLVFESTTEVIQAEKALKKEGFNVRVMGPPPEIQSGCDMVLEVDLNKALEIERILRKNGLEPLQFIPVEGSLLKPVDIFQVKDYGQYLMVRAANMKMTVDRNTLQIVNISGGGCPDVPWLAELMIGRNLKDAPQPVENGATLCGYALQLALEELQRRLLN
jgi:hypothetical protein